MQVVRLHSSGIIDKIFAPLRFTDYSQVVGKNIIIQPNNGNILVTGNVDDQIFTAQWKSNGQLDTYFGDRVMENQPTRKGYTLFAPQDAQNVQAYQIVSELNEYISVLASYTYNEEQQNIWIHYTKYGILDPAFGNENPENSSENLGYFIIEEENESLRLWSMILQPHNQNNLIAGLSTNNEDQDNFIIFDYLGLQAELQNNKGRNSIKNKKNTYGKNPANFLAYLALEALISQISDIQARTQIQELIEQAISRYQRSIEDIKGINFLTYADLLIPMLSRIKTEVTAQYPALQREISIFFFQLDRKLRSIAKP